MDIDSSVAIMAKAEPPASQSSNSDLLFAWLSPIEAKVDRRLHPKSPSVNLPVSSPLVTKARSAIRKTVRASHVNSFKKSGKKAKGACLVNSASSWDVYALASAVLRCDIVWLSGNTT